MQGARPRGGNLRRIEPPGRQPTGSPPLAEELRGPVVDLLAGVLPERPLGLDLLREKAGRQTIRARTPSGSAIVKTYPPRRALRAARVLEVLADGPAEPTVPRVLALDVDRGILVLSEVPGLKLRKAVVWRRVDECRRAGAALGAWHRAFSVRRVDGLAHHTVEKELEGLRVRAADAPGDIGHRALAEAERMGEPWETTTVVHRDLQVEHVLLDERVGLIDLDTAAIGPPELDIGMLIAHVQHLGLRRGRDFSEALVALVEGYGAHGPPLSAAVLDRCRRLSLLRRACLHGNPELIALAATP